MATEDDPPESLEAENETAKNSTAIENECLEEYEFDESSWLLCAGHIEHIVSNLVECRALLTKLKSYSTPNPIIFLLESQHIINNINSKCELFLRSSKTISQNISNTFEDQLNQNSNQLIEHDPGKRGPVITSSQKQYLIAIGPLQPELIKYPVNNNIDKVKRQSFNSSWFNEYPKLEYSLATEAAYCFVCSLFPKGAGKIFSNTAWVNEGVRTWDKMKSRGKSKLGKLEQHFTSLSYKASLSDYCSFMKNTNHIDVIMNRTKRNELITLEHEKEFNRQVIVILFDIVRTLSKQGLAFRGDGDESGSNFNQIVQLISRHNPLMNRWIKDISMRSYKVSYLGSRSQNEMIEILLMADTTPDISHKDRLAVCVRYINNKGEAMERLLEINEGIDKTGLDTAKQIVGILKKNTLNTDSLSFQSYDFASNMSGSLNGAQVHLSKLVGHEVYYIPCQAHRMNTFLEHGCNTSLIISNMISNLESLYVFFSAGTKCYSVLNKEMDIENKLQLKNLSKTRWTARAESIEAVWNSFEALCISLHNIYSNSSYFDGPTRTKALGLHKKMHSFDFIVSLKFMKNIMYKLKMLTETLEKTNLCIIDAANLVDVTINNLDEINKDNEAMDNLIQKAISFLSNLGIDPEADFKLHHRQKKPPSRLDPNSNTQVIYNINTFYRKEFKYVLSTLINLSKDNLKSCIDKMKPLFQMLSYPLKKENISLDVITSAMLLFPSNTEEAKCKDIDAVQAEMEILIGMCLDSDSNTFDILMNKSEEMKHILPWANKICKLALTAPVSVATNERSFSKLRLIKNNLRSSMGDNRLDSLMILSVEKDVVDKLDINKIATL
ncbi:hypothetical protein QTP88_000492 [Uroleucon formosanum]